MLSVALDPHHMVMVHHWRCCPTILHTKERSNTVWGQRWVEKDANCDLHWVCIWGSAVGEEGLLGELGFPKPIGLPESLVPRSSPVLLPALLPDNHGCLSLSVPRYQFQTNITEFTGLNFVSTQMILLPVCIHYCALILYSKPRICQACLNSLTAKN